MACRTENSTTSSHNAPAKPREAVRSYEVTATRAGRRVEVLNRRGMIEVSEVTRGGTAVRTARFMASRVLALVEHPAPRRAADRPARGMVAE